METGPVSGGSLWPKVVFAPSRSLDVNAGCWGVCLHMYMSGQEIEVTIHALGFSIKPFGPGSGKNTDPQGGGSSLFGIPTCPL